MTALATFETIEAHAEGEPSRIVMNAASIVHGSTMAERLAYCRKHLDGLRKLLLHEPRGYPGLCAVFVLPAVNPGSDVGIIVLEQGGFTPMSGSNTMCVAATVLEAGLVPLQEPATVVTIDTAVGVVRAIAHVSEKRVNAVTVQNVPAFVVDLDFPLEVTGVGTIPVDIVFGGQFFAQAKAADCGVGLSPQNGKELARMGALIKLAAREQTSVIHPLNPEINQVSLVMLHSGDRVSGREDRNTVVLTNGSLRADDPSTWTGSLDRSPCGTGTSARMAALYARGQLAIGEEFRHISIIGSEFVGQLTGATKMGGRPAVRPTVTGRVWVTGHAVWTLDESDMFPTGFTVGDIWSPEPL